MPTDEPDDARADACGGDGIMAGEEPLPDEHVDLFVLFAEALDPNHPKTVEEAEAEWRELFG